MSRPIHKNLRHVFIFSEPFQVNASYTWICVLVCKKKPGENHGVVVGVQLGEDMLCRKLFLQVSLLAKHEEFLRSLKLAERFASSMFLTLRKSPNVLCAPLWTAKLCDFGLATWTVGMDVATVDGWWWKKSCTTWDILQNWYKLFDSPNALII